MARSAPNQFRVFLATHAENEVVTATQILAAVPGWKKSSLDTYRTKHKLDRFLAYLGEDRYRVICDGSQITETDINAALTQVTPRALSVARGDVVQGAKDEYELVRARGRGAVGTVWEARSKRSGAIVAVKLCDPRGDLLDASVLSNVLDRFRLESRLGGRVQHNSIIRYLDVGEHTKAPFLVMELADESVRDRLERQGKLTIAETARIGRSVVAAVRHLHVNSCVHRDIKPANILMVSRGYVLADLGILRWGDLNRDFTGAGTITKASVQLGSWNYMAPEQVANPHNVSSAADVYALGVTLIELLTGKAPIAQMVAAGRVPPPSSEALLNDLIVRMTSYEPGHRASLDDVDDVLAIVLNRHANAVAG
jgi:serine/threonine protein kinase